MSKVLAFFADGLEMVEGLSVVDVLRRARVEVEIVSIKPELEVTSSHQVKIVCDKSIDDVDFEGADMIFLPGGMKGTQNLDACEKLRKEILSFYENGKYLAAVCAAPTIYGRMGLLKGKRATCYPGLEEDLIGAEKTTNEVEKDGNMITSRGLGTSIALGLELISVLCGEGKSHEIAKQICYQN